VSFHDLRAVAGRTAAEEKKRFMAKLLTYLMGRSRVGFLGKVPFSEVAVVTSKYHKVARAQTTIPLQVSYGRKLRYVT